VHADQAAEIVDQVDISKASEIVEQIDIARAIEVLEGVDADKAAEIVDQVDISKASDILAGVEPKAAGQILSGVETETITQIVQTMDEDKLIERLTEVDTDKLFDIDPEVLFDELPKVPTEQLVAEVAPELDPDLPQPEAVLVTENLALYRVQKTGQLTWAKLVGSPIPIAEISGKFNKVLENLEVEIASLDTIPQGAPGLGSQLKVNSIFNVNLGGSESGDIVAAHVTVFIEKAWLDANDVNKWSLQFQRLDEGTNRWVPFQTKRVREDEERVYYAISVPGFSTIAITGSNELPERAFEVTGLSIQPASPVAGETVTVSVTVRNISNEPQDYPASLWLNSTIEQVQVVNVAAGQSFALNFAITAGNPGAYDVRIERELGTFTVRPAPVDETVTAVVPTAVGTAVVATETPAVPPPEEGGGAGLIITIVIVIVAVVVVGAVALYIMQRRRR